SPAVLLAGQLARRGREPTDRQRARSVLLLPLQPEMALPLHRMNRDVADAERGNDPSQDSVRLAEPEHAADALPLHGGYLLHDGHDVGAGVLPQRLPKLIRERRSVDLEPARLARHHRHVDEARELAVGKQRDGAGLARVAADGQAKRHAMYSPPAGSANTSRPFRRSGIGNLWQPSRQAVAIRPSPSFSSFTGAGTSPRSESTSRCAMEPSLVSVPVGFVRESAIALLLGGGGAFSADASDDTESKNRDGQCELDHWPAPG